MQPPPLAAQFEDRHLTEPGMLDRDVDRRLGHVSDASRCGNGGRRQPLFEVVSEKPSFFFTVPAKNPRTLCCCHFVACIISSMLAPSGRLSRVSMRSCLVTRSTFGSSALTGVLAAAARSDFDTTDRGGFLTLAVADVTLRRLGAEDLALPFLDPALSRFGAFSMEKVDMILGSFGSRRRNDARTTQSPAHRGTSPQCADGGPSPPADAHSNAYYAAEVQSVLRPEICSHVLGKLGPNNNRLAFPRH
jgi:hypothetical protein